MKRVIFDVDGVLANFSLHFRTLANKRYGLPIYGDDRQFSWDMEDLTKEQDNALWHEVENSGDFWFTMPHALNSNSMYRILRLTERTKDREVYFVTSRVGPTAKEETERWLKHKLGIYMPTVLISNAKHMIVQGLKAHYAIDDKFENAVTMGFHQRNMQSFLLDKPYNRGFESKYAPRIKTVEEFLDTVE